jgi:hypothetical protein
MESIYASEPTADDKPVMESGMESTVDDEPTAPPKHLVNVVAMANGLCDTERTPARKGRRSQSRTCCRNRQSRQTNRYLAHDDVHCSEHPSLSESNSTAPDGLQPCGTVARHELESKRRTVPSPQLAVRPTGRLLHIFLRGETRSVALARKHFMRLGSPIMPARRRGHRTEQAAPALAGTEPNARD